MSSLSGKAAIITGGGKGTGLGTLAALREVNKAYPFRH
jgi:NAD(P)-dependent dehydrogenase (short-subunit alcohol dehydrogenase family)